MRNEVFADSSALMNEMESVWCYQTEEIDGTTLVSLPMSYPWAEWLQMEVNARKMRGTEPLNQLLKMDFRNGVLLYGDPGNGRHTVGKALLKSLRCPCLFLNGFLMKNWDAAVFCQCLTAFAEQFSEQTGEPAYAPALSIFVEELSQCSWAYALLDTLNDLLEPEERTFFLVVLEDEYRIPDMLRKKLLQCRFRNPNPDERLRYLTNALDDPIVLLEQMEITDLAEKTEGFSYSELNSLVHWLRLKQRNNYLLFLDGRDLSMLTENEIRSELPKIVISRAELDKLWNLMEKTTDVPPMPRQEEPLPLRTAREEIRYYVPAESRETASEEKKQPVSEAKTQSEYFEEFQRLPYDAKENLAAEMYKENHTGGRKERMKK